MIETRADRPGRITLGADKGYDTEDFVDERRSMTVVPQVMAAAKDSAPDEGTTRHGYVVSLRIRTRIEKAFVWVIGDAALARALHRGIGRVGWRYTLAKASYDLARLPKLLGQAA